MGNRLILIVIVKVPDESFHKLNRTTMMGSVCDRRIMVVQREKVSGFHVPSSPWSSHNTWVHDDLGLSKVGSTSRNALAHFLSIWWASVFSLFNWKGQLHLCHLLLPCPRSKKAENRLTWALATALPDLALLQSPVTVQAKGTATALTSCTHPWELLGNYLASAASLDC